MKKSDIKRITSFTVDHDKILPGIYVSRIDMDVTTYDMRLKQPNNGDYMTVLEAHTFEHMFATYVRNSEIGEKVIYFGPMGCMTGFYLLVRDAENGEVLGVIKEVLSKITDHDGDVFGASRTECGNYRCLELEAAKNVAREFSDILKYAENNFSYPS